MGKTTTTTWTCDVASCRSHAAFKDSNSQPVGWKRIMVAELPLANPLEMTEVDIIVCSSCYQGFTFSITQPGGQHG